MFTELERVSIVLENVYKMRLSNVEIFKSKKNVTENPTNTVSSTQ